MLSAKGDRPVQIFFKQDTAARIAAMRGYKMIPVRIVDDRK